MQREGHNIMMLSKHVNNVVVRWNKDFQRSKLKLEWKTKTEDLQNKDPVEKQVSEILIFYQAEKEQDLFAGSDDEPEMENKIFSMQISF